MLSPKQEAFCLEYMKSGNATEAYLKAGYKTKTDKAAGVSASRLLGNVGIVRRLKELQQQIAAPEIADAQEIQSLLTDAMRKSAEKGDVVGLCKAADILNKMHGAYINKTEISGGDGGPLVIKWLENGSNNTV